MAIINISMLSSKILLDGQFEQKFSTVKKSEKWDEIYHPYVIKNKSLSDYSKISCSRLNLFRKKYKKVAFNTFCRFFFRKKKEKYAMCQVFYGTVKIFYDI